jgi:predicted MFS family arabinose efflux permease
MDVRLMWLAFGTFAGATENFMISGVLPDIGSELGVGVVGAAHLVFAYSIAYGLGTPVMGAAFGAADRRRVLAIGELIFGLCAIALALAPVFWVALAARIGLSLGAGLYTTMAIATAIALAPEGRQGRWVSVVVAGQSVAVALGAPLGAWLAAQFGWRVSYLVLGIIGIIAAALLWFMIPSGIRGRSTTLAERLRVVTRPGVASALVVTMLFMVAGFFMIVYRAPIVTNAVGTHPAMIPLAMLFNGVGAVIGNIVGGQMADRLGPLRTVVIASIAQTLVLVALWLVPMLPPPLVLPGLMAVMLALGVCGWTFFTAQLGHLGRLAADAAPLAVGLNSTAVSLGTAVAALIGGLAFAQVGAGGLGLAALPFAVAGLLVLLLVSSARRAGPSG